MATRFNLTRIAEDSPKLSEVFNIVVNFNYDYFSFNKTRNPDVSSWELEFSSPHYEKVAYQYFETLPGYDVNVTEFDLGDRR